MSYDLYVTKPSDGDAATQLRLLVTETSSINAVKRFVKAVRGSRQQNGGISPSKYVQFIQQQLPLMGDLGLQPSSPDLSLLPPGSWFLQFTFTLAKPWMSKDDDPFYVAESVNPVRKDKVFKIPVMSAAAWKGLLRWTMMHIRLALQKAQLSPDEFSHERLAQTLFFGDEKGEEPGQNRDFAAYLDELGGPLARKQYEQMVRAHFHLNSDDPLPHHSGRLMFYPTFFDQIDVEVVNPHKRETKAGTHPIYLECVPAGAQGTFGLLYVPFDLIGQANAAQQAQEDLQRVAETVREMMLTYGFSAKRTSGYGTAADNLENGLVRTRANLQGWKLTRLSKLTEEVANVTF